MVETDKEQNEKIREEFFYPQSKKLTKTKEIGEKKFEVQNKER